MPKRPAKPTLPFLRHIPKGAKITSWSVEYDRMPPPDERNIDADEGESKRRTKRKTNEDHSP